MENYQAEYLRPDEDEIDIKGVLKVISNYKWLILVITLFAFLATSIYLYFQPSIYSSYTILKVKTKEDKQSRTSTILNPISEPITTNVKEDMALIRTFYINDQALKLGKVDYKVQYYEDNGYKSIEVTELLPIKVTDIEIFDKGMLGQKLSIIQKDNGYIIKIKYSFMERLKAKLFGISLRQIKNNEPFKYNQEITTEFFKLKVNRLANYAKPIDIKINAENRYIYENIIKGNLKVSQIEDEISLIKISYNDGIRDRGVQYLESLTETLIKESIKNKNEQNDKVLKFIMQELKKMKGKLTLSEQQLERYRIRNEVIQPSVQATTFIKELTNIDIKLSENSLKKKIVGNIDTILSNNYDLDAISPLLMVLNDKPTLKLIEMLQDTQLERDELLSELTYKHPTILALQKKIDATKAKIVSNIKNLKRQVQETEKNLNRLKHSYESKIKGLPTKERTLINIKRDYEVSSKLYKFLLKRKAENEMVRVATLSDYKVIDKPYSRPVPVSPKHKLLLTVSIVIGVITGIILAFILDSLYDKIRDKEDIEKETNLPICETLPSSLSDKVEVYNDLKSHFTDSYRNLRTKLRLLLGEKKKIILVTSIVTGEEADIVSANLGVVFAMAKYKTLLIDLDIRGRSLDKILDLKDIENGLADYLLDGQNSSIIYSHKKYNLDIIPVGKKNYSNPSELILSDNLSTLIERVKQDYDYIIINSTPFGFIQDTKYIMQFSDINLVVFKANYSKKSDISNLNRVVKRDNIKNMQIIFIASDEV